jgi:hypothetical protein
MLCLPVAHKSFCAVLWHILCRPVAHFVPSCGTFCAVLWHILCRPVAHKSKSLCVPFYGTFCAFPWHISRFVPSRAVAHFEPSICAVLWHILCLHVAHKPKSLFVPCYGTFCACPWHISFEILFVKNFKSRIASQELQKKVF